MDTYTLYTHIQKFIVLSLLSSKQPADDVMPAALAEDVYPLYVAFQTGVDPAHRGKASKPNVSREKKILGPTYGFW